MPGSWPRAGRQCLLGLGPRRRWPGASVTRHPRCLGQAERPFADDVPLYLAGARVDGAGPAAQEDVLPLADRISVAVRPQQPVAALDADRDLAEPLVVLAPEQLGHRGLRARRPALGHLGEGAQPAEPHDLGLGVGPGELLPHQGVAGLAALARRPNQVPELALEALGLPVGAA